MFCSNLEMGFYSISCLTVVFCFDTLSRQFCIALILMSLVGFSVILFFTTLIHVVAAIDTYLSVKDDIPIFHPNL